MKKIVGGSVAISIGFACFSSFSQAFFIFWAGIVPLILLAGGCLTIYLKYDSQSLESKPVEPILSKTGSEENTKAASIDDTPQLMGNTGTQVFHSPDCKFSKSKKCTAVFNTRDQAIQEGYKPCGICKP